MKPGTLAKYIKENISQDVDVVMTDDFNVYRKAVKNADILGEHKQINHSLGVYAIGDLHTNSIESSFSVEARHHRNVASHKCKAFASLP